MINRVGFMTRTKRAGYDKQVLVKWQRVGFMTRTKRVGYDKQVLKSWLYDKD